MVATVHNINRDRTAHLHTISKASINMLRPADAA